MTETTRNITPPYMQLRFLAKNAFENTAAKIENYVYLFDNFNGENPAGMLLMDRPEFINRNTLFVGIYSGQVELTIDGQNHTLQANSFNYIAEHCVLKINSATEDLKFFCITLNHDLLQDVFADMGMTFKMPSRYKHFSGLVCSVPDMKYRLALYNELRTDLNRVFPDYAKHIAQAYLSIYLANDFHLFEEEMPDTEKAISRQHTLFRDFVDLLEKHCNSQREVQFYARELGISSKYLSALCIEYSGKNASSWIDDYVISRVKALMQEHRYTIKEIAQVMNFPTQSFFGRYFKRITGKSPRQYMIHGEA